MRLFVAVDLPSDVRLDLEKRAVLLHERIEGARWTPAENWHVTLVFLGRTWPRLLDWVKDRLVEAAETTPAFRTSVRGFGAFPSTARARILWAGLDDDAGAFAHAAANVAEELSKEFRPEERPFAAHLTLARMNPPARVDLDPSEDTVSSRAFGVKELVLYRSHLRRPAPIYEALARFPLAEGGEKGGMR